MLQCLIPIPTVPDPQSVIVTSSLGNVVRNGSDVTLTCAVRMNQNVFSSELSVLMVSAQLTGPGGSMLTLSDPVMSGIDFTYTAQVNSFGDSDIGNYTCVATVEAQPNSVYLTGRGELSNIIEITIGKKVNDVTIWCDWYYKNVITPGIPPTTVKPGAENPGENAGSFVSAAVGGVVAAIVALGLVTVALAFFTYCFVWVTW